MNKAFVSAWFFLLGATAGVGTSHLLALLSLRAFGGIYKPRRAINNVKPKREDHQKDEDHTLCTKG